MAYATGNTLLDQDFSAVFDVGKVVELFPTPSWTGGGVMDMQRKNMEALVQAQRIVFEGTQAVMQRQQEIARQAADETLKAVERLQDAESNEARVAQQAEVVKTAFTTAQTSARELAELRAKSYAEALDLVTTRIGESIDELRGQLQELARQNDQLGQALVETPTTGQAKPAARRKTAAANETKSAGQAAAAE